MDVVVKYAVSKLGFQFDEIILFGWSIGTNFCYFFLLNYLHYIDIALLLLESRTVSKRKIII